MPTLRPALFVTLGLTAAIALAREPVPVAEAVKPVAVKAATAVKPAAVPVKAAVKTAPVPKAAVKAAPVPKAAVKAAPVAKSSAIGKAAPVPVATPVPKKEGFWARLFGKKTPAPTPIPATPTPKPVKKKIVKKYYKPKPKITKREPIDIDVPPGVNKVETTGTETTQPVGEVAPIDSKPPVTRSGRPKGSEKVENFPPATDNGEAEAAQKQKYDQAKTKAAADPKVKELRSKADTAPNEEESRKALRLYNREMFKRMKEIDPSIKEHVERMEGAVMKRLGE